MPPLFPLNITHRDVTLHGLDIGKNVRLVSDGKVGAHWRLFVIAWISSTIRQPLWILFSDTVSWFEDNIRTQISQLTRAYLIGIRISDIVPKELQAEYRGDNPAYLANTQVPLLLEITTTGGNLNTLDKSVQFDWVETEKGYVNETMGTEDLSTLRRENPWLRRIISPPLNHILDQLLGNALKILLLLTKQNWKQRYLTLEQHPEYAVFLQQVQWDTVQTYPLLNNYYLPEISSLVLDYINPFANR